LAALLHVHDGWHLELRARQLTKVNLEKRENNEDTEDNGAIDFPIRAGEKSATARHLHSGGMANRATAPGTSHLGSPEPELLDLH
jgi:hypothetical protein